MQSIALTLTLTALTGTLVALDLSNTQAGSQLSLPQAPSVSANRLAVMPNSLPGVSIPKADIKNGAFAMGSSTDREGLFEDEAQEDDTDETSASPEKGTATIGSKDDFVLI